MLPAVVEKLLQNGIANESDGAVIVAFPKKIKPKMLSETVLVIQKSDGAYLYGTTDLATLEYRQKRWAPKKNRLCDRPSSTAAFSTGLSHLATMCAA